MNDATWAWPISETFHFIGLALLIGTIGVLDLRILGMAKGLSLAAMHQLVPVGIIGFAINLLTGLLFLVAAPVTFLLDNDLFWWKLLFILLAGINVLIFYVAAYGKTVNLSAGDEAPMSAKAIAMSSLLFWSGVIVIGRIMAFV